MSYFVQKVLVFNAKMWTTEPLLNYLLHSFASREKAQINDIIITWMHAIILDTEVDSKRIAVIKDKIYSNDQYDISARHRRNITGVLDSSFCHKYATQLCYIVRYYMHWKYQSTKRLWCQISEFDGFSIISPTQGTLHGPFGYCLTGQAKSR